jgi:hypothetical protein
VDFCDANFNEHEHSLSQAMKLSIIKGQYKIIVHYA